MRELNVVFMGTPEFSVPILSELIKNTNVKLVVTAPDAFIGRKKVLTACPVKQLAQSHNIEVFSPEKVRKDFERIKEINPDIIVTCAYGQIIPKALLDIPRLGCINIHASLLPKYRGGAPIHWALLNGDNETGITLMYMDPGIDTGDIIKKEAIEIELQDNIETLSQKLSLLGSRMIIENLPSIIDGTRERIPQNNEDMILAPIIKREDEHLDFHKTNDEVFNKIRALSPNPLGYFTLNNIEYKIVEAKKIDATGKASTVIEVTKDSLTIMCAKGAIKITKIKPFGKNIMLISAYFNGIKKEELLNKEVY